jgi:hypothetical protein
MGLILRTSSLANPGNDLIIKGSALTANELDGNFVYLLTNMSGSTISITGSTGIVGNLSVNGSLTVNGLTNAGASNIVMYNNSTGQFFYLDTGSISVSTASYILSSNVFGPDGADSITNALFASSSTSASYALIADSSQTAVSSTTSISSSLAIQALTASYVALQAGPGITTNGIAITASVRSVNGNFPDANGNILTSLTSTIVGTSASLVASSSGDITGSLSDGLVWIIAGDPNPNNNGDTYIFSSGSVTGSWYPISTLDTAAGDARYLKLTPQSPLSGSLDMGGFDITNIGTLQGTSSWANNALTASYVSSISGLSGTTNQLVKFTSANTFGDSTIEATSTEVKILANTLYSRGTNPNIIFHAGPGGGGSTQMVLSRSSTGNQAKIFFSTTSSTNFPTGSITAGADWSMGTTNGTGRSDFKIGYGDIQNSGSVALTIATGSKYVGINRTLPEYNLHVSGTVSFTDLTTGSVSNIVMIDTTTGQLFYTSSTSVVSGSGILINNNTNNYLLTATGTNQLNGESNLQFDGTILTVTGSVIVTGSITSSADIQVKGFTVGQGSTGLTSETFNTAFGRGVLVTNISGSYNTGIGWSALSASQLSNDYNTAIGAFSLPTTFTGSQNTAGGAYSLGSLIVGGANTAFGALSLLLLTSGSQNAAFGAGALDALTTGSFNSANGTNALGGIITGDGNIAAGNSAGSGLRSGSSNVFVGRLASSNLLTGSNNIAIGFQALRGRGSGINTQNTVAIGHESNYTGSSNGVYIGYQAGYNETSNNKLYISNDSSSSPLIKGDFSTRLLEVNGDLTVTGSSNLNNGLVVIGSTIISGSTTISGSTIISGSISVLGSINATSFTGSFNGVALTASYIESSGVNGPNGADSIATSSYALYAVTSSYVQGGALNYVPLWSGSNILTSSAIYQNASSLIGIGTTSPFYNLDVSGSSRITNGLVVTGSLIVTGSTTLTLTTGTPLQNIVLVDTASGQLYYTSSTAVSTATLTGGAANRIPLWSSTSALTTSSFFQSGSSILLGATSSTTANALHIIGSGSRTGFRYTGRDNFNYVLLEDGAVTGSGTSFVASFYKFNDNTVASLNLTPGSSSLISTDILTLNSNIVNVQGDVFTYVGDYEGNANNVYIEVDQADSAIYIPLGNVGIGKASSLNATLDILGNVVITGSLIAASSSLSNFLRIIPSNPLPSAAQGAIAVSGSGVQCKPYFYNGSSWNPFYNVPIVSSSLSVDILTIGSLLYASGSSVLITGSLTISGSSTLTNIGTTSLTGSLNVSGSTIFRGVHTLSGSNTITGNTVLSGSIEVSGSSNFNNSLFTVTGSSFFKGTHAVSGSTSITGSFNVVDGDINIVSGSSFRRWGNKLFNYGSFYHTASVNPSQNISGSFTYSTTSESEGVNIVSGSRVTFANTGKYNIQFSVQVSTPTAADVHIWLKSNGVNVADTAGRITTTNNDHVLPSWNYIVSISSGSYIELAYQSTATNTTFPYIAATGNIPSIPPVILTVTQIA